MENLTIKQLIIDYKEYKEIKEELEELDKYRHIIYELIKNEETPKEIKEKLEKEIDEIYERRCEIIRGE